MGKKACPDLTVPLERPAFLVFKEFLDNKVLPGRQEPQVFRERKVSKDFKDSKVVQVPQEQLDRQVNKDLRVNVGLLVSQVQWVHQDL